MAVYVDDMDAEFGRMRMCHMVADTPAELRAMARRIGVPQTWIQYPGTPREHFDIAKSRRAMAVEYGAIEVTWRWVGLRDRALRLGEPVPPIEYVAGAQLRLVEDNTPAAPKPSKETPTP
jgi:hypothetical protein